MNEKTIEELVRKQQEREKAREKAEAFVEYKGHKLKFAMSSDGHLTILSEPPLITVTAKDQADDVGTTGPVDVLTPNGWVRKN